MLTLIRKDPALRTLPRWLIVTGVAGAVVLNIVAFAAAKKMTVDPSILGAMVWAVLSLYLIFGEVGTRCSTFDMALPIPARRLWLSHLAAVTISAMALFVLVAAMTACLLWLLAEVSGRWVAHVAEASGTAAQLAAGLILAVAWLQTLRPSQQKIASGARGKVASTGIVLGALAIALLLDRFSPLTALVSLTVALWLVLRGYRQVPTTYTLTTDRAAQAESARVSADDWTTAIGPTSGGSLRTGWLVLKTVHRVLPKKKASYWVTIPFVLFFGALLAGIDRMWLQEDLRFAMIPMGAYLLMAFTAPLVNKLHVLDGWPMSHGRLFGVLVLPALAALLAGYGMGRLATAIHERSDRRPERIEFCENPKNGGYYTCVPHGFYQVAWRADAPPNEAPWGEVHEPTQYPLWAGSAIRLYSPFSTGTNASIDFVAWQISRATEAIYGVAVPPGEIKDRYLHESTDGHVELKTDALTIARDHPELMVRGGGPLFPVIVTSVVVLWLLVLAVFFGAYRASVTQRWRNLAFWGAMIVLLAMWVGQLAAAANRFVDPNVAAGFMEILIRRAGESAVGTVATYVVGVLLCATAYAVALARFKKIDVLVERAG